MRHDKENAYYLVDLIYELDEKMKDEELSKDEKIVIKSNLANKLNQYNYELRQKEKA